MNSLDEKKRKALKCTSKILYIISIIIKVCAIVGAICIFLCLIVLPSIMKNIEFKNNELYVYDSKVEIVRSSDNIDIQFRGEEYRIDRESDVKDFNFVLDLLEKQNLSKIKIDLNILLLGALAELVFVALTFEYLKRLFDNVNKKDTPFIMENVDILRMDVIFMTVSLIIPIVVNILIAIISKTQSYSIAFSSINITTILSVLALSYIFEYGVILQSKSNKKIYVEVPDEVVVEEKKKEAKVVKKTTKKKETKPATKKKETKKEVKKTSKEK
jgi:hypothetical protein